MPSIEQRNNPIEPGTVIHATLRSQDLIPAFLDVLRIHNPEAYQQLMIPGAGFAALPSYAQEDEDSDWWYSEDADHLVELLFDSLNELAPEGHYFGSHPGDGSDFGFWACEED